MNGVFDLGGTDGFGAVGPTPSEPVFHEEWERIVFGLQLGCFAGGWFNIDSFRHGIELMDPVHYLTSSYYEHWLATFERHGVAKGHIDADELDRRTQEYLDDPEKSLPVHEPNPALIEFVDAVVAGGSPATRPTDEPKRFEVGDVVRMRSFAPHGHTRLARYVRGKAGTVVAYRGSFVYPDHSGNELGESPQHLYTVQFDGAELWGELHAESNTSSTFDAWDPYIDAIEHREGATA
ncbi:MULTISPECIES: nitrile hydratase subunit beta [unclassified Nocardioides]|uniref:nitrile hydratase subunit beta n=1 Tax=unclassified Nocardioides TaxID=2615069 RepID=UPI000703AD16|nr:MULTISPECIES: nitrile hydratase subunit beta [unclassified Nocardioides]KRC54717.1 nitrile hydratase subunit beta [Nocardioides sp. Root79]KRC73938.1 nitrile hydratase subunit beta [Nocardioides sp. Root240]